MAPAPARGRTAGENEPDSDLAATVIGSSGAAPDWQAPQALQVHCPQADYVTRRWLLGVHCAILLVSSSRAVGGPPMVDARITLFISDLD